jgi:hypothetical protein
MLEDDFLGSSIINLDAKVSPSVLAGLVGRNVSYLYQLVQSGRIPVLTESTYRQCIQAYINDLTKGVEAKLAKVEAEKEIALIKEQTRLAEEERKKAKRVSFGSSGDDGDMHPVILAKYKQNIKTERVREEEITLKNSITRGKYIDMGNLMDLTEPFIMAIRDTLVYIANSTEDKKLQAKVDEAMDELRQLGTTMLEDAEIDGKNYVDVMLARDFDDEDAPEIEDEG